MSQNKESDTGMLQEVKQDWSKGLKLAGRNEDGENVIWYVDYRGKGHWRAFNDTEGKKNNFPDDLPSEQQVKSALEMYDNVSVVSEDYFDD